MRFEHSLPSTSICHLFVTPEMVLDPAGELAKILSDPVESIREEAFQRLLSAEKEGVEKIVRRKVPEWQELYGTRGWNLLKKRRASSTFSLPKKGGISGEFRNRLIQEAYREKP